MPFPEFLTWLTGPDGGLVAMGALVGGAGTWGLAMRVCNARLGAVQEQIECLSGEVHRLREEVVRWQSTANKASSDLVNQLQRRINQLEVDEAAKITDTPGVFKAD